MNYSDAETTSKITSLYTHLNVFLPEILSLVSGLTEHDQEEFSYNSIIENISSVHTAQLHFADIAEERDRSN